MPWWAEFILGLAWPLTVVLSVGILSYAAWRCCRSRLDTDLDLAKLQKGRDQPAGDSIQTSRMEASVSNPSNHTAFRASRGAAQECDACGWLFALIESQEVYHAHKEQMAWVGTALWMTAASYLLVQEPRFWNMYSQKWLVYAAIATALIAGFAFVRFQFKRREQAAAYSNACMNVAARWLTRSPTEKELLPDPVEKGIEFPAAVTAEVKSQLESWRGFEGPRVSEYLTYFVMAVFAIMVIVRVATA